MSHLQLLWKEQGDKGKFLLKHDSRGREVESWTFLGGDERLGRDTNEEVEEDSES